MKQHNLNDRYQFYLQWARRARVVTAVRFPPVNLRNQITCQIVQCNTHDPFRLPALSHVRRGSFTIFYSNRLTAPPPSARRSQSSGSDLAASIISRSLASSGTAASAASSRALSLGELRAGLGLEPSQVVEAAPSSRHTTACSVVRRRVSPSSSCTSAHGSGRDDSNPSSSPVSRRRPSTASRT